MSKSAVLIGFYYEDSDWKTLGGVLIDLYLAYKHFTQVGFKTKVITDCDNKVIPSKVNEAILEGIVDVEILDFLDLLIDLDLIAHVDSKREFEVALRNYLHSEPEVVIYFSGHGSDDMNGLVLPDNDIFAWSLFRRIIIENTSEIAIILDCCYPSDLNLPYVYSVEKNRFVLREGVDYLFTKEKIISIQSSEPQSKSISSNKGSLFTRAFFKHLLPGLEDISLKGMVKFVQQEMKPLSKQRIACYSSYPQLPIIQSWIRSNLKIVYQPHRENFLIFTTK
jgi:hypothetical protein